MQAAAPRLREAIDVTPFSALRHRLIANVDARVHEHAREMPALLEKQVSHLDSGDTRTYKPLGKTFAFFGCHGPAINSCLRWRRRRPPFLSSGMV